jgi:glycosyltransferase involved in cell wall biosynthesis
MEQLSGSPELQQKLAANGFAAVSAGYDWSVIAARLMQIYEEVLK